jgi:hypothetical protein
MKPTTGVVHIFKAAKENERSAGRSVMYVRPCPYK